MQTLAPAAVPADPATSRAEPPRRLRVLVPVAVGLALGPVDLLLQHVLPYPFANLANSPAAWALVAFAVGWFVPAQRRWGPALAGTVTLLLAVEGYYLTAVLAQGDDPSTLADTTAQVWCGLAVGAGVVFGTAGAWARSAYPWRGPLGTAAAVGVLLAEAWLDLARTGGLGAAADASYRHDLVQTALVLLVLAGLAAVLTGRSARQRVLGAALALPLALTGPLASRVLGG